MKSEMHPLALIIIGGILTASLPILAMLDILQIIHIDSILGWILLWGVHVGGMIMGYLGAAFYVRNTKAKQQWIKLGKDDPASFGDDSVYIVDAVKREKQKRKK